MKKNFRNLAFITFLIVASIFILGCGEKKEFYPLEDLSQDGINMEAIRHYKTVFNNTGFFNGNKLAIQLGTHGANISVMLHELDYTGKVIDTHYVRGELKSDIFASARYNELNNYSDFSYDIDIDENTNDILGTRSENLDIFEAQNNNFLAVIKQQLMESGYPDADFSADISTNTIYYGKFILEGDVKNVILDAIHIGYGFAADEGYSFSDSRGVITGNLKPYKG